MIETIKNAWNIPELKKKILFTLFILLIYRIGNAIPVPYVDVEMLGQYFDTMGNTVFALYNAMSGGAFSMATIFALSIQPYINASIIIQLLTVALPPLERLAKEGGEDGRKKIASITRYLTVGIGLLQGFAYYMMMVNYGMITNESTGVALVVILSFTAGASFLMWLGEQINEFGIGNGISVILFASIISRLPNGVAGLGTSVANGNLHVGLMILVILGVLALVVIIAFISNAERRIPVQYAKRVVGRKMYGGQNSHLPMKVNMSGVMPIIFAQSIASLPATFAAFFPATNADGFAAKFLNAIDTTSILYIVVYFLLILAFSYFYATIQFNPIEVANNLKKNGGFIPGFRPGKPTSDFVAKCLSKITMFGAIYLGIVAIIPIILNKIVVYASGGAMGNSALAIGGTSVIIVVGVALETVKAMEAQMLMRHYKGFLE